jgi:hypothetical protein
VPVAYTYIDDIAGWFSHRLVSDERRAMIEEEQAAAGLKPDSVWGETEAGPVGEGA